MEQTKGDGGWPLLSAYRDMIWHGFTAKIPDVRFWLLLSVSGDSSKANQTHNLFSHHMALGFSS